MDCRTARLLLDFARPRCPELEGSDAEALEAHLADCAECGPLARGQRLADARIGQAVRDVPLPDGLRGRLLRRLEAQRRGRGWRDWRVYAGVAAAAAAIAVVVLLGLRARTQAHVDLELALTRTAEKLVNPRPEAVEEDFRAQGVRAVAPRQFNYRLLTDYGVEEFQGKRVGWLLFTQGERRVWIRVLPASDFDLGSAEDDARGVQGSGGFRVEVWRDPAAAGFGYLIIYTGDSLKPFLADKLQDAA